MTSRATEKVMGEGGVVWSYFLPFPLADSAFRCSKLLDGGLQGLRIGRMGGQELDKLIQADVTKEMAFKEGGR